jgi:dihydrodipicolinate synthase/N-acetylneuraminate lyase
MFNGLLFFPVTPYGPDGEVDLDELAAILAAGLAAVPEPVKASVPG